MGRLKTVSFVILFVGLFVSCADNASEETAAPEVAPDPIVIDTTNVAIDSSALKYPWLDSLQSDDASVRLAALKRYRQARASSDGDGSEILSAYLKTYVYSHPKEFLSSYSFMSPAERVIAQSDIAYELYASSNNEYQRDIDEYFSDIDKSCTDCSTDLKKLLKDFKIKVEVRAKEMAK